MLRWQLEIMVHSEYEEVSVLDCLFVLKLLQQHHFLENAVSMVYGNCYRTSWLIFFSRIHYTILCLSGSAYLTWSMIIHPCVKQCLTGSKGRISMVLITAANPGTQQRCHVDTLLICLLFVKSLSNCLLTPYFTLLCSDQVMAR